MARVIFNGEPGAVFTNDTGKVLFQFVCQFANSCGVCISYARAIGPSWPIPLHRGCRCQQRVVLPGKDALPFVDFMEEIRALPPAQRAVAVGRANWQLVSRGVVDFSEVVTPQRVRTLREVVSRNRLDVGTLLKAGVNRRTAEQAYQAVHTPAHELAAAHRKTLVDALAARGLTTEQVKTAFGQRVAGRVGIASGPVVMPPQPAGASGPGRADVTAGVLRSLGVKPATAEIYAAPPPKKAAAAKPKKTAAEREAEKLAKAEAAAARKAAAEAKKEEAARKKEEAARKKAEREAAKLAKAEEAARKKAEAARKKAEKEVEKQAKARAAARKKEEAARKKAEREAIAAAKKVAAEAKKAEAARKKAEKEAEKQAKAAQKAAAPRKAAVKKAVVPKKKAPAAEAVAAKQAKAEEAARKKAEREAAKLAKAQAVAARQAAAPKKAVAPRKKGAAPKKAATPKRAAAPGAEAPKKAAAPSAPTGPKATPARAGVAAAPVRTYGTPAPAFDAEMKDVFAALPARVHEVLGRHGVEVAVCGEVRDALGALADQQPRGWPPGMTWEHADGAYNRDRKQVIVSNRLRDRTTGDWEQTPRGAEVLRHETGHAFDAALGFASRSPAFRAAFAADDARLPSHRRDGLAYFLQAGDAGPSEAFAELFAQEHGGGTTWVDVRDNFPDALAVLRGLLK